MAGDTFVEIKEIPGDCEVEGYKGQHDAEGFSWSISQAANMHTATGGAASSSMVGDFSCSVPCGKGDPNFAQYCALGKHIPTVKVHLCKSSGDTLVEWYTYTFNTVIISSYSVSGGGGAPGYANISFNFADFQLQQFDQDDKGSVKAGPDVKYSARLKKPL